MNYITHCITELSRGFWGSFAINSKELASLEKKEEAPLAEPAPSFSRVQIISSTGLAALASLSIGASVSLKHLNPNLAGCLLSLGLIEFLALPIILFPHVFTSENSRDRCFDYDSGSCREAISGGGWKPF